MMNPVQSNGNDGAPSWREIVAVVGAGVGGAAWVSTLGSAVVALRMRNADLPAESVVALMSAEHRFVIGATYLIAPLAVGLIACLADLALQSAHRPDHPPRWSRLVLAGVLIALGAAAGALFFEAASRRLEFIFQCASIFVILVVVEIVNWARGRRAHTPVGSEREAGNKVSSTRPNVARSLRSGGRNEGGRIPHERVVVFASVLIAAGSISLLFESRRSPAFDHAQLHLKDQTSMADRYYVTTTSNSVVLLAIDGSCPAIDAVPRDQIESIHIGPARVVVHADASCRTNRSTPPLIP
jgi:hypothetical protein